MRRILAAFLAMLLLCCGALAEELLSFESYSQAFAAQTGEVWEEDGAEDIQVLQPEDGVTISACLENGSLIALTVEFPCDNLTDAARGAIENLGWLSETAMAQLLAMEDDETAELEGYQVVRIHGESRDAYAVCLSEDFDRMVWQPIHGGKKVHNKSECSGMDVARMITEDAAGKIGWENCKKCRKKP